MIRLPRRGACTFALSVLLFSVLLMNIVRSFAGVQECHCAIA